MSKDIQELEQTLASEPGNRDAFAKLEDTYFRAGRWQDLVRLYEGQEALQKEVNGYWERAVTMLEKLGAGLEEPPERAEVMVRVGKIWEHRLERRDQAMVHYQRAFKVWPYKTESLALARNIYAAQKNWKLVLRLFELQLQVEKEPERQAEIHAERGRILMEELDEKEPGLELVNKALELDPNNIKARDLLESTQEKEVSWEDTVEQLRGELARSSRGPAASKAHLAIARLIEDNDPDNTEAIEEELKASMAAHSGQKDAQKALFALYRRQERWEELMEALEQAAGRSGTRKEEVRELLIELAAIQREQFGDEAAAVETFEKVLALDPSHPDALRFAQNFYEREQKWEELVGLYENALRMKRSSPEEQELRLALGELIWKKIGDMPAAERHYRRVRLADPKRPEMLRFYQNFFKEQANWKKYYSTLATLRQSLDDSAEIFEINVEMARVASQELKSPDKAIDVWKSVLKQDGTNQRARQELHDLYIQARKWNALLEHYKEEITILEREDSEESRLARVELSLKMVEIYRDKLRLDVMVINTYNAILQIDPDNADAIDALAQRYEKSKRWNDLISILQKKCEVVGQGDRAETLPLLHRIAALWQKRLGNVSQAIPALEQVLEIDPGDKTAITELKKIYNKRHKWEELLVVLEKEAALLEGRELAAHLAQMARTARQRLNDAERAQAFHERVCEALEGPEDEIIDAALYRGALGELEKIYAGAGDDDALVKVYQRRLKVTQSTGQRIEILDQLASLVYGSLGDADYATSLWNQILELQPNNQSALDRLTEYYVKEQRWDDLEALFGQRGDWPRLFEILDTGADMVDDDAQRVALFHRMARIAKENLEDSERVMISLESVLRIEPANIEVAKALLPYYREAGQASKEIQANQILLDNDGGDAYELSREIGRLYEVKLEDLPSAFDWADKAFQMKPEDQELRVHIEALAHSAERLAELVASYRQVAEGVDDEPVRLALYRTIARTTNVDLEWFDDAVDYYERILRADGQDAESIDALLILYRQLQRWEDLLDVMQRKNSLLAGAEDQQGVVQLHFQMAELLQGPLERRDEAIEAYRTILSMEPQNLDAVRGLKALHEVQEDWTGVASAMETELGLLEAAEASDDAAQLRLSLGHLYENQLEEPDRAVDWYASLLDGQDAAKAPAVSALEGLLGEEGHVDDTRRVRIATLLEPVHRRDENHGRLTQMLEIRLGDMDDEQTQAATLWELAGLYENQNEDLAGAFSAQRRLLALTPGDDKVWNDIERLGGSIDQWEELASLYADLTPQRGDTDAEGWSYELLRRQARIYEQELGLDHDARDAYEVLLERDKTDRLTIDSLEKVYTRLGAWAEKVDLLEGKAQLVEDEAERRAVYFSIAALHEEQLHSPDAAIDTFNQVLEANPADTDAQDQLERLLGGQERWHDLVELLGKRVDQAEDDGARHDIRYQLGQVQQNKLDDLVSAVDVYRGIVQANPDHAARGALEQLSAELDENGGDLELRMTIDDTLEPIYAAAEDWPRLVHVLGLKLGYADEDGQRVALGSRIARLHRDKLDDPTTAFDHLRQAVALSFADDGLRGELEALADNNGSHDQVVALYEDSLMDVSDDELRHRILQRIATIQEENLGDVSQAIDAYRRMHELDESDAGALGALERLHEQESQWDELVQICLAQAELAEGDAQVAKLRKVGQLYRGPLEDPHSAIDTYKRILDLAEGDAGALDALEELYIGQEAWRELIHVLHDKIQTTEDAQEKRAFFFRIASLHEEQLTEPFEAIGIYNNVLEMLPEDGPTLDALDRLYQEHERWEELANVLERKLALEQAPEVCNGLQFRLGQVQQHQLFEVEQAIETYRAILERASSFEPPRNALVELLDDPAHRFAASKVLEPLYRTEAEHGKLVELLELQLLDIDQDVDQLVLLDDVARIQEKEQGNKEAAFHAVRRAYLIDPSAKARVSELERLAEETTLYEALVREAYEPALPEIDDEDEVLRVHLKIATVCRDQLREAESAETSFRNALAHRPDSLEAMGALEDMLTEQSRWHDLLEIKGEKFNVLHGQGKKDDALAVLFQIAHLHDEVLGDPTDAIETYRRVLDMDEANAEAIHALKGLYRRESHWEELTALLLREIGYASDKATVVALRSDLATIYKDQLMDVVEAVGVYRQILSDAPDHASTIESLEALFAEGTEEQLVASILEPIYRRREDWAALVSILEVHLKETYDTEPRQSMLTQIARLQEEKLQQPEAALGAYQRLLDENPNVPGVWDQLERLATTEQGWEEVADAYGRTLEGNMEITDESRLPMLLRRAQILDERLDQVEQARDVYREVLFIDDENAVALDATERLLTRMEDWFELVELYRRTSELAQDEGEQLRLYYKIATLQEEVLRDPDAAIEAYRFIQDLSSEERDAVRGLERLYKQEQRWRELADLYRREADLSDDTATAIGLRHQLGSVLCGELDEVAESIGIFRQILEEDPTYAPTRGSLEELLRTISEDDLRLQIAMMLQPLYDEQTEWEKLIYVYEVQLEVIQDPASRVQILRQVAHLRETYQNNPMSAFDAYARAFNEDIEDVQLQENLERLAETLGNWGALIEIYLGSMGASANMSRVVELLHRAADLYLNRQKDSESAITVYSQILDIDDRNRLAIARLEELYKAAGQWDELVQVLYRRAELEEDVLEKKETYYRIAELWEKSLSDDDQAIDTYRIIMDLDDEDLAAIEALERLYERTGAWENLIAILQVKVDVVDEDDEKIGVYEQMASIYEDQMMEVDEAISTFLTIRDIDEKNLTAIRSLNRLYATESRWDDLLDILEVERALLEPGDDLNALEFRMAQLLEEELGQPERAIGIYSGIVSRDPNHSPSIESLEALINEPRCRQEAAKVLEPLYERQGEWRKLVDALELAVQEIDEPDERRQTLSRIADIHENKLDSRQMAFITYGRAFNEMPDHSDARGHLERLATQMGNYDELVAIYEEKLDDIYDFELSTALNMRLGEVYRVELGDNRSAVDRYQRVVDGEEYHAGALNALDELYVELEEWSELVSVLERKVHITEGDQQVTLKYRLAHRLDTLFEDYDRAISLYKEILDAKPKHAEARGALERLSSEPMYLQDIAEVLEPIYKEQGHWEPLIKLQRLRLEQADFPSDKANLLREIAEIVERRLEDPRGAFDVYSEALQADPEDENSGPQLERLAAQCDTWAELTDLYEGLVDEIADELERRELMLKVAGWHRHKLGNAGAAEGGYKQVLDMDPGNERALDALEGLYTDQRRYASLYDVYSMKADALFEVDERKVLFVKMAEIANEQLGEPDKAIDAWVRLRDVDDTDTDALDALIALYREEGLWGELVEVLERRSTLSDDIAQRVAIGLQIGEVSRDQMDDPDAAIDAYRNVLDLESGNATAMDSLEALYRQTEQWSSLQEVLGQALTFAPDDASRIALHRKLAKLNEDEFQDLDGALEHFRQISMIDPDNADALAELERLYTRGERWYDLQEVYIQRLEQATDPAEQLRLHVAISNVAAEHLGDVETAKEHLQKVLSVEPDNMGALDVLGKLYAADYEWEQAMGILERQIAQSDDEQVLSKLHLRRGTILEEHMEAPEKALEAYQQAMGLDNTNAEAREALKRVYRDGEHWENLVNLYRLEGRLIEDDDAKVKLYMEMAEVSRTHLNDAATAVEALEVAYAASGQSMQVAEPLLQSYVDAEQWGKAEPILAGLIETLKAKRKLKQLFKFYHLQGQIAERKGDADGAMASYKAAYDIDATYVPNLLSLGKLYVASEEWDLALKIFQTLLLHQMKIKDKDSKRDVYYNLGRIRAMKGDARRAKDMFNRALAIDKGHAPSIAALESLS